jgi:hypothetical protein
MDTATESTRAIRPHGIPATVRAIVDSAANHRDASFYASQFHNASRRHVEGAIEIGRQVAAEIRNDTSLRATVRGPERREADALCHEVRALIGEAELADRDAWLAANPGGYAGFDG